MGSDVDHYCHGGDHDDRKFFNTNACRLGLMLIITLMMAITTITKFFYTKCLQVGSDDDHNCHDGDHDDRQVFIRNTCRWGLMSIPTVLMAITTIAKYFYTKCLQVGSDDDHYMAITTIAKFFYKKACRWGLLLSSLLS
jgi:hypothetical protein